jgi:hypothetical protein
VSRKCDFSSTACSRGHGNNAGAVSSSHVGRAVKRSRLPADKCPVPLIRRLAVPLALLGIGVALGNSWTAFVFYAAALVWTVGIAADAWVLPALGFLRHADTWSRRLIAVEVTTLVLWTAWGLLEALAGPPGLTFLSFGLVSLPVGALLLVLSLVGLAGAAQAHQPRRYGVAAACLGCLVAVLPFAMLLSLGQDLS